MTIDGRAKLCAVLAGDELESVDKANIKLISNLDSIIEDAKRLRAQIDHGDLYSVSTFCGNTHSYLNKMMCTYAAICEAKARSYGYKRLAEVLRSFDKEKEM